MNLKKKTKAKAMVPGKKLLFLPSISGSCFETYIVDLLVHNLDCTYQKCKSQFSDMVKQHLDSMKGQGKQVKYLCCNNVPENGNKLANICKEHSI